MTTAEKLTQAIGITYAEVRTKQVRTSIQQEAQQVAEWTLQNLLASPVMVKRMAEIMDAQP